MNRINDIRGFRLALDNTFQSSPPIRSNLAHPIVIRRAVPKIEAIPSLPSNFQIMFDDATIQKLTTVLFSATATFMLAFTARLISSRLHPPLNLLASSDKENENDNVTQRLSGADKFTTLLPPSEETVDHQGQCQCERVRFRIRAHRELHVVDHSTSKLRFPRVLVSSDSFEWLMDASALKMFSLTHQDGAHEETSAGSHIFCSDCGTQLVFVPVASADAKLFDEGSSMVVPLQVNLDCIDKKKVQCIHHHHHPQALASIPIYPSRLSKATVEEGSSSQRSFFHHYKQLVGHTQTNQSGNGQSLPTNEEVRQAVSVTPTKSPVPVSTDTTVMSSPSQRLNSTSGMVSGVNNGMEEPEFDEYEDFEDDDDDADFDVDDVNRSPHSPRFALNMQLNSLGHYSDQRRNKRPTSTRSQHGQLHHGRHSNVFFPNHGTSRPSSTHPHYPHGFSQSTPVQGKGRRDGAMEGSAPDSDTTEELFFEQFYAPPSPFSPLAAGVTPRTTVVNSSLVNGHSNGSSNYLQYILGADDSQLVATTEIHAAQSMQGHESMITPPRVKPNKTYRPIHHQASHHHHHSQHSHHHPSPRGTTRRRSRSGTPTSHRSRPSPVLDGSHSHSQSGTSSPASSLSASASGSGSSLHSSRRLRNFQSTMEDAGQDDFHGGSGSSRRNSSGKGRSLLFSTATLRDEYGDEIIDDEAVAGVLIEDAAVFGDLGGDDVHDDDGVAGIEGGDEGSVSSLESLPRELPVQRPLPSLSNASSRPGVFPAEVRQQNVVHEDTMDDMTSSASAIEQLYDSPSSLWQRRNVTMRKSTPGRLHTTASKAGHKQSSVRSNEGMEASTYSRGTVSYGGKASSGAMFSSPFDEPSPVDMPSYQNLKRYLDRHLSPSSSNNSTVGGKSVQSASSASVNQAHL